MKENKTKGFFKKIGKAIAKPFVVFGKAVVKAFIMFGKAIKNLFLEFWESIRSKKFRTLVAMQIKDKWNFSFKANKKGAIFKIITYVLIFIALCAISWFIMNLASTKLHIFLTPVMPITAMVVLIVVLTVFEGLSILIGLSNALYFNKDNPVLITYPVTSECLFISKLTVYFIDAIKKAFTLLLPILFGYAFLRGYAFYFFPWIMLWVVVYMAILVLVCGLLSVPTYYVLRFLRKYKVIKIVFSLIIVGLLIFGTIKLIQILPDNFNLNREYEKVSQGLNTFLNDFSKGTKVFSSIGALFCGVKNGMGAKEFSQYSYIVPLCFIGAIIVMLFVDMAISKPFYSKMIANSNSTKTSQKKERKNHREPKGLSILKYEVLRIVRDEKLVVASIISIVVAPLLILLLNKFYGTFQVRLAGRHLINIFNYFFILLIATTHNISSAYIFSKDGPSWNINKTIPVNPKLSLSLRLVYNFVISLAIILPAGIIFISSTNFVATDRVFILISLIILTFFHNLLSASYDFMNSKNKTKADIGSEIVSKHQTVSIVYAILIGLGVCLLAFIMYLTSTSNVFMRITFLALALLILEVFLFFRRIRGTYQEN